ncbi:MAG: bifunctional oligoribonuclease/PAP phosphatase NrnA [Clostridia bacterium]|nr:bifunctional oligoribonuclease/PAP phosphatase NrnA [Clostridia bacterium]MBR0454818.1 bifunctional oligoribonuclease/PAP phosphatase NrnA [Clostridia bacterium]
MFEKIIALIEKYDKIIIHRHQKPDGDALGSQLGLLGIIRDSYPEKQVYAVGDMTPRYAFMAEREMDEIDDSVYEGALAIILDTSAKELISDSRYTMAEATARLDHHLFVEKIADEEVTDSSFESCCGLVAAMAMEAGLSVSAASAKALYTGMITDSGRFRYSSTSANTFRVAAFLIDKGFDTADIYRNLYSDELFFIQLRAKFVLRINVTPDRVGYIYTTKEEAAEYGADSFTLSRGMVNVMSEVKGIDSWVNFTETESGVLCEIRSSLYNINPIAVKYGGGGHQMASGATLKDREEAMSLLEDLNALGREGGRA